MKIKYWIKAARLRTLPLAFSCIIMGAGLSMKIKKIDWSIFTLCIITTLLLQILSNFANDYGDGIKGTDENRKYGDRMIQQGLISKKSMFNGIIICSIACFLSGCLLIYNVFYFSQYIYSISFIILGIIAIAAAIKYTVGKSAYGYQGFGDIFVFLFFGIIGVMGTFYLLTNNWCWTTIPGSLFTGLMSVGVLNMNNMRDFDNDSKSNKNTIVVKIGIKKAKIYQFFLILISIISYCTIALLLNDFLILLGLIPCLFLIGNIKKVLTISNLIDLDTELKKIALVCFVSSTWIMIVNGYIN
ncbi:MAG: 1,4-dihydroxy-2-naphthoate octaprenyltransferase [Crocinitomicaceae bacterium]|nr:1,4-dihydroxy-2-naphthoate octaprenyltransferase [Crocinitomicaceae bacterium]|tara:strand:- start:5654 stop:6553 length:900 start_codon:yes stop_codon:yes gene_type:complete